MGVFYNEKVKMCLTRADEKFGVVVVVVDMLLTQESRRVQGTRYVL